MTRVFVLVTLFLLISIKSFGQCVDPPTIALSSTSGSTCARNPITVSNNTFGGIAENVTIITDGAGTISPRSTSNNPFEFTYTPSGEDIGFTVLITFRTDIPKDPQCTEATASYVLTVNANPAAPLVGNITQPTCTSSTGSVVLSGLPLDGSYIITRSPGGVTTTGSGNSTTISGIPSGTYTFTVTNSTGCTSNASADVDIDPQPPTPSPPNIGTRTQPTCTVSTGSIRLTGLPGGGWTITRYPGGVTTTGSGNNFTIPDLEPGTYTFTVTNSVGCTSVPSANGVINTQPATPTPPAIGTIIHPTCTVATGSVGLTGLPASGSWTVTRSPGGVTTTGSGNNTTISGIAAGTYTFIVTNSSGCTSVASTAAVINPQPPIPSPPVIGTITNPTCLISTGTVELNGLPPVGSWTITRTPGGITYSGSGTSTIITGLAAGTYTFTVTNSSGCTSSSSANAVISSQILAPSPPVVGTISQPTCTVSTGSVVLSGLPLIGTWTLTRSPGGITTTGSGTSTTISNLTEGTYTYTVTNALGCVSSPSGNIVIAAPPAIPSAPVVGTITPPTCSLSTGSVILNGLPSTGTWTLIRYPGVVTSVGTGVSTTISGLTSGLFNYTVTNAAGCVSILSANVVIPVQLSTPTAPLIGTITQPRFDLPTGSVVVNGLPASGSWTLTLLPENLTTLGSGISKTISGLAGGTYSFTVTNAAGCISAASASFVINTLTGPPIVVITNPDTICVPSTANLTLPKITAGSAQNLTFTYWTDAFATIPYTTPASASAGTYYIKGTTNDGFFTIKPVTVTALQIPLANAGPDQVLANTSGIRLNAQLANNYETGVWSLFSGSGEFIDTTDAKTVVNGLSMSRNTFLWTVSNGVCPESSDSVSITISDLVIPTLITPNMDGKNDYFILNKSESHSKMELIIFDRRGAQVYKNSNYDNSWDGVDYNGNLLSDDTYFYVYRIGDGVSAGGYIVIRR